MTELDTMPFRDYISEKLEAIGGRRKDVPDQIMRGFTPCRICSDWQRGENLFVEFDADGKLISGHLCGRCAGIWAYNPNDETQGCLVPVLARIEVDPVWGNTPDAQRHPWIAVCHRPKCYFSCATDTEENGNVHLALHTCPMSGSSKEGLMVPLRLVLAAWSELDDVMDLLMEDNLDNDQRLRFRGEARGIAKALAIMMPPPFKGAADEVAREAQRRYKARESGDHAYQTKGLEVVRYAIPPHTVHPELTGKQLNDQEKAAVKFAAESGMFTSEQLADTYGVSVAVVNGVVNA